MLPARLDGEVQELRNRFTVDIETEDSRFFIILRDYQLPDCYEPNTTDLMIMADYQYPLSALDMFWTFPEVRCASGALPQNADQYGAFAGVNWQRWSYHYEWNPAHHSLSTHLDVFDMRLAAGT